MIKKEGKFNWKDIIIGILFIIAVLLLIWSFVKGA